MLNLCQNDLSVCLSDSDSDSDSDLDEYPDNHKESRDVARAGKVALAGRARHGHRIAKRGRTLDWRQRRSMKRNAGLMAKVKSCRLLLKEIAQDLGEESDG